MISALGPRRRFLDEQEYLEAATSAATLVIDETLEREDEDADTHGIAPERGRGLRDARAGPARPLRKRATTSSGSTSAWHCSKTPGSLVLGRHLGVYKTGATAPETVRGLLSERDDETPAVNSVAAMNLLRLAALTGNATWRDRPAIIFQTFGDACTRTAPQTSATRAAYELR